MQLLLEHKPENNNQQTKQPANKLIDIFLNFKDRHSLIILFLLFFVLIFGSIGTFFYKAHIERLAQEEARRHTKYFIPPTLEASSAIAYDVDEKVILYQKNANEIRPLASITKLMTALVAYKYIDQFGDTSITISSSSLMTEGESGLIHGEQWKLHDLIGFMLVTSSNDAAVAIAESLMPYQDFLKSMNDQAKLLGTTMEFRNPTGLDYVEETIPGATGTAQDVAILVSEIMKRSPEVFQNTDVPEFIFVSESGIVHKAVSTNKSLNDIPHVLAGKTGFTDLAGGNLAVAVNAGLNKPIVLVVLGSSVLGRFIDIHALSSSTQAYFGS